MHHDSPRWFDSLRSLPDDDLLQRLAAILCQSRRVEADLVAHVGEVDERRLFAREASPSMYAYCTEVLHLSEAEAYLRITVARAARTYPFLLDVLRDGRLHLTGIVRLLPHLTPTNADVLLQRATHKTKRQILELVAEIAPRPDVRTAMRRLPERPARRETPTPLPAQAAPSVLATHRPQAREVSMEGAGVQELLKLCPDRAAATVVEPLAPARYRVQFTASAGFHDKLERLQALMRTSIPDGDLAAIIEAAVTEKLERLEAKRFATRAPRKSLPETDTSPVSRHIPAAVRRAVALRDGNQCRYVDEKGRRCTARHRLEFHHRRPYGLGGDHSPKNVSLVCRVHNAYLAEHDYGRMAMAWHGGTRAVATGAT